MKSVVHCETCGAESERKENFVDLQAHFNDKIAEQAETK